MVEDLGGGEDLSRFALTAVRGARDGDRLTATAMFSDSASMLTLELRIAIGSPSRLETGTWRWVRGQRLAAGLVDAQSVEFLGGQDGPPSVGGTFVLRDAAGSAKYRVRMPVTELKRARPM